MLIYVACGNGSFDVTSVGVLLEEKVQENKPDDIRIISEKLAVVNLQLAKKSIARMKGIRWGCILLCTLIVILWICFAVINGSYLSWNYNEPELAVAGTRLL